jgi:hypothetical protein
MIISGVVGGGGNGGGWMSGMTIDGNPPPPPPPALDGNDPIPITMIIPIATIKRTQTQKHRLFPDDFLG